jgi:hypothetical protein
MTNRITENDTVIFASTENKAIFDTYSKHTYVGNSGWGYDDGKISEYTNVFFVPEDALESFSAMIRSDYDTVDVLNG